MAYQAKDKVSPVIKKFCSFFALVAILHLGFSSQETFAQGDKYSFRLKGLGQGLYGFVDDLYSDISINPAYIHRFEGNWLFTNLSNLQGGNDVSQLDQNATLLQSSEMFPSNLIGTISDRFGSPFGIFWESAGSDITRDEFLENTTFTSGSSGIFSSQLNALGTDFTSRSITGIGLIDEYGVSLSLHKFGFGVTVDDRTTNGAFDVAGEDNTRLNTSFAENSLQKSFDFSNTFLGFSVGRVFKSENSELSIAVGRSPERFEFDGNELFSLFKEPFFGFVDKELAEFDDEDFGQMEIGLRSTYLHLRSRSIESSAQSIQIKNYLANITRYTVPFSIDVSRNDVLDSLAVLGANRKTINNVFTGGTKADGDLGVNRMELGAGIEKHFDGFKSMLAYGVKFDYIWGDLDFGFKPTRFRETNTVVVEIGDPAEEDDSYQRVISDNKSETTSASIKGAFFSFPVGFETKVASKFTFRVGVRSTIPVIFDTEWETKTVDGTDELIETTEDVTTFIPDDGFQEESTTSMKIDGKSLNLNSYHFGASYDVNDMIKVDLLHFAKITELDTWWLSITFKY